MTAQNLSNGDKVCGVYHNKPFSGIIRNRQVVSQYAIVYYIDLDSPIVHLDSERTNLVMRQDVRDDLTSHTETHYIEVSK